MLADSGAALVLEIGANLPLGPSDADITNFKNHVDGQLGSRPAESCEELVVETMRLLDGEACWNCVRTVATALVNEGLGRRLDEEELMRSLASGEEDSE